MLAAILLGSGVPVEIGTQLGAIGVASHANFFAPGYHVEFGPWPIHVQAVYTNATWEVTLDANLKAKVVLGSRYEVLSVNQMEKVPADAAKFNHPLASCSLLQVIV